MTGRIDRARLVEATLEAALVLGLVTLPVAWRVLDASLTAVLSVMLVLLTAGVYALHAVTFDCFRLTGNLLTVKSEPKHVPRTYPPASHVTTAPSGGDHVPSDPAPCTPRGAQYRGRPRRVRQ